MPAIDGLITGLNTTELIDGMLALRKAGIAQLQAKQATFTQKRSLFTTLTARLHALQIEASKLGRAQNNAFDARIATSSNQELLNAAAGSTAAPGTYTLRVNSLARAHQIASQGYDSPTSQITEGTLQIRSGNGPAQTITIDGSNHTLQGLADAINSSRAGVTATIVNDGSGDRTQPYRLLLTANQTGADNAITITNNLAASAGDAIKPVFDAAFVGPVVTDSAYVGTSTPLANTGAGGYTGTGSNTYRFTVVSGGTVGTDDGIQIAYLDATGANSGTITLNSGDAGVFKSVAQGIEVQFSAGTLVEGDSFTIDAFVPTVQAAANASVLLGSGAGAFYVASASNQLNSLIPGVTLNLLAADPSREITLTVAADTELAKTAIQRFVEAFNGLMEYIDEQVRYEAETGKAGPLLGDRSAITIQDAVRRAVLDSVTGANPLANNLAAIGIRVNTNGRLEINPSRLDAALAGQLKGVSLADLRKLFALSGQSTNAGIQFVTGGVRTRASATPYQIDLSQAAEQAVITAANPLAASTVIDENNNSFTITVDGKLSSTISLAAGTYTRLALARELEARINADPELIGRSVVVGLNGDRLTITSATYGFASEVAIGSGTALDALGFAGTEADNGQDVVGKFIVDGVEEPAIGHGQFLVGNAANAHTADLQVRVTLAGNQIQSGVDAELTLTRGLASRLDVLLGGLLDPINGTTKAIDDRFARGVEDLQDVIDRRNALMEAERRSLIRRFAALEVAVAKLRSTSDFLTSHLASLKSLTGT